MLYTLYHFVTDLCNIGVIIVIRTDKHVLLTNDVQVPVLDKYTV